MKLFPRFVLFYFSLGIFYSCSAQKKIKSGTKKSFAGAAVETLVQSSQLKTAHTGVSVYSTGKKTFLCNYQSDKYFIPASNTKIITCYAAMKYLGDSLEGLRYYFPDATTSLIQPTGDPTFLQADFVRQPVYDFLKKTDRQSFIICDSNFTGHPYGLGWSWDDYEEDYMPERSAFPVYDNMVTVKNIQGMFQIQPSYFKVNDGLKANADSVKNKYRIKRMIHTNDFYAVRADETTDSTHIPFITGDGLLATLLKDTLHKSFVTDHHIRLNKEDYTVIYSGRTDSLLKIMMHRSDNFFAEQSLLMVGNKLIDEMNDGKIIDTLLKTDLRDMPQRPAWIDGSGLSRYNLFTPQDFVFVLDKMRNEFSWLRITGIFPTGGAGTLGYRYKDFSGKIFAKTGSLSNNVAFSGYLITKGNDTLIFSVLVSNHNGEGSLIRNDIAAFLKSLYENY